MPEQRTACEWATRGTRPGQGGRPRRPRDEPAPRKDLWAPTRYTPRYTVPKPKAAQGLAGDHLLRRHRVHTGTPSRFDCVPARTLTVRQNGSVRYSHMLWRAGRTCNANATIGGARPQLVGRVDVRGAPGEPAPCRAGRRADERERGEQHGPGEEDAEPRRRPDQRAVPEQLQLQHRPREPHRL